MPRDILKKENNLLKNNFNKKYNINSVKSSKKIYIYEAIRNGKKVYKIIKKN